MNKQEIEEKLVELRAIRQLYDLFYDIHVGFNLTNPTASDECINLTKLIEKYKAMLKELENKEYCNNCQNIIDCTFSGETPPKNNIL